MTAQEATRLNKKTRERLTVQRATKKTRPVTGQRQQKHTLAASIFTFLSFNIKIANRLTHVKRSNIKSESFLCDIHVEHFQNRR